MISTLGIVKNFKRELVALGLAVGVLVAPLSTPAANAQVGVIGGCGNVCGPAWTIQHTPGGTFTAVDCQWGRISVSPYASVNAGWVNGQWATYRYNLRSSAGHNITSGWAAARVLPYTAVIQGSTVSYPLTALASSIIAAARGLSWTVQVQYGAWYGSSWAYSSWTGPVGGYSRGGTALYSYCYT